MKIIHAGETVDYGGCAVALGNFDGLHTAHMKIIRGCIAAAREKGLKSGILLFEENTKSVTDNQNVEIITTNAQKLGLLERENPDFVYIQPFTPDFMKKSPEEFAALLKDELRAKIVCAGYDYRFGRRAEGDVKALIRLGGKYGFKVIVTDKVTIDGETVSSSRVRELIKSGDVQKAAKFLGRYYELCGEVVRGFGNGVKMGLPTANVAYNPSVVLPEEGVYAGVTVVDGARHKSVVNVGKNLTFGAEKLTVESHIIDFDGDIYGKDIKVEFEKRLRGVIKFASVSELIAQINSDKEKTREMNL